MLELQKMLMDVLQQFGTLEIVGLSATVILLLIWLLVRAVGGGREERAGTAPAQSKVVVADRAPAVAVNRVSGPVVEHAAPPQPSAPVSTNAIESSVVAVIPEDSVLRRHYLASLESQRLVRSEPNRTDSAVHRHSEAEHILHLDGKPADPVVAVGNAEQASCCSKIVIPQDSVLKRHFIAQLQAEIESRLPPRPSDSVLLRHYHALLASELQRRLSALKG